MKFKPDNKINKIEEKDIVIPKKNTGTQEGHPTGTPFIRLVSPYEDKTVSKTKYESFTRVLNGEYDGLDMPTLLDFNVISPGTSDEQIISWIERKMEVSKELIEEDGKTERSAKFYKMLNHAYQTGKEFLVDVLKYSESEVSIGPKALSSKKELFDLLHKTILLGENKGLSKAPLYCRVVKTAIVAFEALKHDVKLLQEYTEEFENALVSQQLEGNESTPLVMLNENSDEKKFYASQNGDIKGKVTSRGKKIESVMLRFFTRAESDAKTALKDGIGLTIIVEENQSLELLEILNKWLTKDMGVSHLIIENQSFFAKNKLEEIDNFLAKSLPKNMYVLKNDSGNSTSTGEFQALKITGVLNVEQEGKLSSAHKHARQFEIMIVKPTNKNQKGKMDHNIYEVKKLVATRTRLDGGCPEHIFNLFVKDASEKSGKSEETVRNHLVGKKNSPLLKMKNKNGKIIYVSHSVYLRWNDFGSVDPSLMSAIERANNKTQG